MKAKNNTITIVQTSSLIGKNKQQRCTLKGLGLRGVGTKVTIESNPSSLGMIDKVKHLIKYNFVE